MELKIPYSNEKNINLNNIHINNKHPAINKLQVLIINNGYYWEGFYKDVKKLINLCPVCSGNKQTKIKMPTKIILDEGPHFR